MSNPIFNKFLSKDKVLAPVPVKVDEQANKEALLNSRYSDEDVTVASGQMTVVGAINKTLILFSCLFLLPSKELGHSHARPRGDNAIFCVLQDTFL
jgi:hypothetical protein